MNVLGMEQLSIQNERIIRIKLKKNVFSSYVVGTHSVTWQEKIDHLGEDLLYQKDEYQKTIKELSHAHMEEGTALI